VSPRETGGRSGGRVSLLKGGGEPRRGVYLLPNLATSAGLFCGIFSIVQTMEGQYVNAALAIVVAAVFDVLDGRIARLTNTASRFGVEYDSLCDLVSFGVASGLLIYRWALMPWGAWGWLAIALFIICAAIRLARFNISADESSPAAFTGLPVPAAALTLVSVVLMYKYLGRSGLPDKQVALLLLTYILALLMVSNVAYASFKQLRFDRRQPLWLLVATILALQLVIARYELVIFLFMTVYVVSGPATWAWKKARGLPPSALDDADDVDRAGDDEDSAWPGEGG
jgi:CDP-diacylglycerol--serine O-phosphatidyltransferase